MSLRALSTVLAACAVVFILAAPALAERPPLTLRFLGGTAAPWDGLDLPGHGYGLGLGVDLDSLHVGVGLSSILPESRAGGRFPLLWAEGQWHLFHRSALRQHLQLSPYLLVGVGLAMPDAGEEAAPGDPETVRWVRSEAQPVGMAGFGVIYGPRRGIVVGLDVRAHNLTHGSVIFSGGLRL